MISPRQARSEDRGVIICLRIEPPSPRERLRHLVRSTGQRLRRPVRRCAKGDGLVWFDRCFHGERHLSW